MRAILPCNCAVLCVADAKHAVWCCHLRCFWHAVSDQVRTRLFTVVAATIMFVLAVFTLVYTVEVEPDVVRTWVLHRRIATSACHFRCHAPSAPQVSDLSFSSLPPRFMYFGGSVVRNPRLQVLSDTKSPLSGVRVGVAVNSVSLAQNPQQFSLDCSSSALNAMAGTLEYERIIGICTPVLRQTSIVTDDVGLATFESFGLVAGPPGLWDVTFTAGDETAHVAVTVASQVFDVLVLPSTFPDTFTPGTPLPSQPSVLIVDEYGQPVVGRVVYAYVSQTPFDTDSVSAVEGHDLQGQRYGILTGNASLPSDSNGVARFTDLTIVATSSPMVYLAFYCEGACAAVQPDVFSFYVCVFSVCHVLCCSAVLPRAGVITSWSLNAGGSSLSLQKFGDVIPSLPTTIIGSQVNTTVCRVSIETQPPASAPEGVPFSRQPVVRVTDANGNPVAGKVGQTCFGDCSGNSHCGGHACLVALSRCMFAVLGDCGLLPCAPYSTPRLVAACSTCLPLWATLSASACHCSCCLTSTPCT